MLLLIFILFVKLADDSVQGLEIKQIQVILVIRGMANLLSRSFSFLLALQVAGSIL
jgi:hypothetical protein